MMGVVFDEVVTRVETPPPGEPDLEQSRDEQTPQEKASSWQQQQATFWRRQQRLEAD